MTANDIKHWRQSLGFTQSKAAEAIGVSLAMFKWYERGERNGRAVEIPKTVALACAAIAYGLPPYR